MNFIEYLNANSGLISAIATVVLVAITGWYAYITQRMLKSSEKSLNEQTRPYIIAFLQSEDHYLNLAIKNYGLRPAKDVIIKFTPSLEELDKLIENGIDAFNHNPLLNQNYMPPDFEVKTTLRYTPDLVKNKVLNKIFLVELSYQDLNNIEYNESYHLNLDQYIYDKKSVEFSNNYYFNEISKQLKEIKVVLKEGMKKK